MGAVWLEKVDPLIPCSATTLKQQMRSMHRVGHNRYCVHPTHLTDPRNSSPCHLQDFRDVLNLLALPCLLSLTSRPFTWLSLPVLRVMNITGIFVCFQMSHIHSDGEFAFSKLHTLLPQIVRNRPTWLQSDCPRTRELGSPGRPDGQPGERRAMVQSREEKSIAQARSRHTERSHTQLKRARDCPLPHARLAGGVLAPLASEPWGGGLREFTQVTPAPSMRPAMNRESANAG